MKLKNEVLLQYSSTVEFSKALGELLSQSIPAVKLLVISCVVDVFLEQHKKLIAIAQRALLNHGGERKGDTVSHSSPPPEYYKEINDLAQEQFDIPIDNKIKLSQDKISLSVNAWKGIFQYFITLQ